ncbi:serine/threonine-protein kinase-like protein CCR4 [Malania oleifera]|uniref:serine/threonine-protein kinase-like protein CCR4 n=1 Tax=Malania oleifera TaxID=397392 RepID=UPI0025ADB71E|nr:serine/threonine-protein kinase-like protein CCR4 [Malania oleifera]
MAPLYRNSSFSLLILCLYLHGCLLSSLPFISSLSTVSISKISNEQTLICALTIQYSSNRQSLLNCTSFPSGIQFPLRNSSQGSPLFSGIVGGDGFLCALLTSSTSVMICWRFSPNGTIKSYKRIYLGPALDELDAGDSRICGLVATTRRLQCWQWPAFRSSRAAHHYFSNIAVGGNFVCGLSKSGKITCLGDESNYQGCGGINGTGVESPGENYGAVAAGSRHVCAVSFNGSLSCWGDMAGEKPQGEFAYVVLGENRSCGVRRDGTVLCWGYNNFKLPQRLRDARFVAVEAKRSIFCGVLTQNYSLSCWGDEAIFGSSNSIVFHNVLPGPCRTACPCGPLLGAGNLCTRSNVCQQPCVTGETPPNPMSLVPPPGTTSTQSSSSTSTRRLVNGRLVAFLVVGCIGSLSSVMVACYFSLQFCKGGGCRVHDSGHLDETGAPQEEGLSSLQQNLEAPQSPSILERPLSCQLISAGSNKGNLEEFSLQILLQATDNFSKKYKIGVGSFGSVYYAKLEDGREVAIKRAEASASSSHAYNNNSRWQEDMDNAFLNELDSLSRLNHKNLVRLLGFYEDSKERVLVYEYMNNGSLHDHLHKLQSSSLMSWTVRLNVALEAARGIEYLHEYVVPSIIHRDIKSSNILLDSSWMAKVSDFGLSLMGPEHEESHISLHAAGTVGYMDPEYYRLQQLTKKSDVYSFGVVLLELLSGRKAIHLNENGLPRNVVDFVVPYIIKDEIHRCLDPRVPPPTPFEIEAVAHVGYVAADCVTLEGQNRPTMTEIVYCLERAVVACSVPQSSLSQLTTRSLT